MKEKEILAMFKECEALCEGHFLLSSGLHSAKYLQASSVLKFPDKAELLCKELAEKIKDKDIDVIIGPALGGIVLSYQLAKILKSRSIFAERIDGKMTLRRNFKIREGEKVLIVEDIITTGGSVRELVNLVKENRGELVGIAALIDRSTKEEKFQNFRVVNLLKLDIKTYNSKDCPKCKEGLPLTKPGSRKIAC